MVFAKEPLDTGQEDTVPGPGQDLWVVLNPSGQAVCQDKHQLFFLLMVLFSEFMRPPNAPAILMQLCCAGFRVIPLLFAFFAGRAWLLIHHNSHQAPAHGPWLAIETDSLKGPDRKLCA